MHDTRISAMTSALRRLAVLAAISAACAGCSFDAFTYTVDRYGAVNARQVHLGCHDTYEIYDRPDAGTILVVTNPINEVMAGACSEPGLVTLPRPERMRRVAHIFLEETTDRPQCRITREGEVTEQHTEFGYQCAAPPRLNPAAAKSKRR